ncbi:MAG: hypothetical protein CR982_10510 [Candidatus Cloacimonadota bacterium]|nr:MAG: hypothetical protein CR982_10510 [Candidatus Cloacimonadota bacterium]PIE79009.1 MAG: hypothetical protein CSA15_04970 [Candidatus Delongbacteria bacterium]
MDYSILKKDDFITNNWSGGTTTELFIYPKDSKYKKMDFLFRLSSATVEIEESQFTHLKGVSRKLMVLEGSTHLYHKDHHNKLLKRFDTDSFEGDWSTKSIGKCRDFNLMTRLNTRGDLSVLNLEKGKSITISKSLNRWDIFYIESGKIEVNIEDNIFFLNRGDLLVIEDLKLVNLRSVDNSNIVKADISCIS